MKRFIAIEWVDADMGKIDLDFHALLRRHIGALEDLAARVLDGEVVNASRCVPYRKED
jgi:hypothetical protein